MMRRGVGVTRFLTVAWVVSQVWVTSAGLTSCGDDDDAAGNDDDLSGNDDDLTGDDDDDDATGTDDDDDLTSSDDDDLTSTGDDDDDDDDLTSTDDDDDDLAGDDDDDDDDLTGDDDDDDDLTSTDDDDDDLTGDDDDDDDLTSTDDDDDLTSADDDDDAVGLDLGLSAVIDWAECDDGPDVSDGGASWVGQGCGSRAVIFQQDPSEYYAVDSNGAPIVGVIRLPVAANAPEALAGKVCELRLTINDSGTGTIGGTPEGRFYYLDRWTTDFVNADGSFFAQNGLFRSTGSMSGDAARVKAFSEPSGSKVKYVFGTGGSEMFFDALGYLESVSYCEWGSLGDSEVP